MNMPQRIFIAINLAKEIKEKLIEEQSKWPELPIRWVKEDNIHITLIFLGYLNGEQILKVREITKETVGRCAGFSINLNRIHYGPPGVMPPRMILVEAEKSAGLAELQADLEKALAASKISFQPENRAFKSHITLGRIKEWEFRRIEPEERPEINEEINLSFEVKSIEIMESRLKRGGAEYTILESYNLKPET